MTGLRFHSSTTKTTVPAAARKVAILPPLGAAEGPKGQAGAFFCFHLEVPGVHLTDDLHTSFYIVWIPSGKLSKSMISDETKTQYGWKRIFSLVC